MRLGLIGCLLCWLGFIGAAHAQGRVSGVVQDSVTHEPLAFSSVFLANTTLGVTTNEQGQFSFDRVPRGGYDIVGSYVGYKLSKQHITVGTAPQTVTLTLASSGPKLDEVVVKASSHAADDYRRFADIFVGQSANSKQCRITNPGDVDVAYSDTTKELTAQADNYLQVENQALGYRIKYYGLRFAYDADNGGTSFYGQPVFEEMKPKDDAQRQQWVAARAAAYYGSLTHFLKSVRDNRLKSEGYLAQQVKVTPNRRYVQADTLRQRLLRRLHGRAPSDAQQDSMARLMGVLNNAAPVLASIQPGAQPIDSLRRVSADREHVYLRFRQELQVAYFGEAPDPNYEQPMSPLGRTKATYPAQREVSRLKLTDPEVEIMPNGTLADPLAVEVGEYWGFEKIGEFLPLDYVPPGHSAVPLP
ncbi:carboxypeptidase-like regulatory domain-containing protein [Hymenobacter sp. RP-2-7]|uniref:Carboxypeptidase-like regulatory domain-containing protein n=1 Tax=Hymenobacter polaris TaxID=2682546 RepID=A0A7Y0AI49_9BACT|nr:carboxypeptidase-like regulatory domain-containing protein [Hymenobacter polaris]NML67773.1 carboxypeptidase-like regulatory domain-containing protein [Hymenobacter polaris]